MAQKQPKRPTDLNQWAKRMVDLATGEAEHLDPTPEAQREDSVAVRLGTEDRPADSQATVPKRKQQKP